MANRRVYEIARERGLTTSELLQRLERDGIHDKKPLSTIDEDLVDAALADTAPAGEPQPAAAATQADAAPPASPHSHDAETGGPQLGPIELRRRLWRLRRERDAQLKELGGLAVELRRVGSTRYDELAGKRLEDAAETERELLALERQLSPEKVGGVCPSCGLHTKQTRYCLRCGEELPARQKPITPLSPVAILAAIVLIAAAWFVGGSTFGGDTGAKSASSGGGTSDLGPQQPAAARGPQYKNIVATVKTSKIQVYSAPRSDKKSQILDSPNLDGAKVVFLVKKMKGPWLHVYLPTRPNGSTGWIKKKNVKLAGHSYRVVINLDKHVLKAYNGKKKILRTPIGVGRAVTPTPVGLYYITELLKQPDPSGTYGPYAFGLSAHSDVLNEFAGRDGVLGVHGTNFPQGIGTNVSHGCIRLNNKSIIKLAHTLPVGTPVRITRSHVTSA
ncbi:MAG TPA: translation initiation factor IF-2 N-terminal domain-containing protein [Thermoleophilaceae bacterium]